MPLSLRSLPRRKCCPSSRRPRPSTSACSGSRFARGRRWGRWIAIAASLAVTFGAGWYLLGPKQAPPIQLGPEYLGSIPGVTAIVVTNDEVQVRVVNGWRPSPDELAQLRSLVRPIGRSTVRIVDSNEQTLVAGTAEQLALP